MFESDDYDQILSQLDLPEQCSEIKKKQENKLTQNILKFASGQATNSTNKCRESISDVVRNVVIYDVKENIEENISINDSKKILSLIESNSPVSPKQNKRKLINSYFDHNSKRKFPGPAGLLNGNFEESKQDDICQLELLTQDFDYSQNYLHKGLFESPLWVRLLQDTKGIINVDSIKSIKQQALEGKLRHQKAKAITAYIESFDRSAVDPLIVLRDTSENIKCTLHRDAWVAFSPYIVAESCALVLCNPTVLTTGSAFKKHYLNITLRNIYALYSSAIMKQEDQLFPTGFNKIYEGTCTIIRNENQNCGYNQNALDTLEDSALLDELDSAFSDDIFT